MQYTVKSDLPEEVHGVTYMKNSHFIELTDKEGRKTKVNASGIIMYHCDACSQQFFMFTRMATVCPICKRGSNIRALWMRPQLAFIPEQPSDFRGGFVLGEAATDPDDG